MFDPASFEHLRMALGWPTPLQLLKFPSVVIGAEGSGVGALKRSRAAIV